MSDSLSPHLGGSNPMEDHSGSDIPVRMIVETAMDGIISMDANQNIVLFNSAAEAIFGWRAAEVIGQSIDKLIPGRFRTDHRSKVDDFGQGNIEKRRMGTQRTVIAVRASGEEFPIEASISQTTVGSKKLYTVILRDVTEAVRYRQQIEEQSEMLDQVSDAVSVLDLEGRITYWNNAATHVFGWTSAQALGRNGRELLFRGEPEVFEKMQREIIKHRSWVGELVKATRDNKQITVEHRRSALRDQMGAIKGFLCIDIDITDRRKREQAARRSQRLESIGTLAGGIAHDLNNVLTPILMGAKLLSSGRELKNRQGLLDTMVASAERGADLVKQVLAFAGGIRGERSPINMAQMVLETRRLMEHTLPKSIQIETVVEDRCPNVLGDATEISQILMNLCINARDAMPDGGTIRIESAAAELNQNSYQINPDAVPGQYVLVKVSDTGCGMTADILERIFDPFFTTKEVGKGTGLGLATVRGIVKSYDGFINVYSEPDRGTMFSIYLPAIQAAEVASEEEPKIGEDVSRGQSILLVDDESYILQMTTAVLEANGYRVLTAPDGVNAISQFRKHQHEIAIVLLDMMMPGLDGMQTLEELRKINSEVMVIACSGLRTIQRESEVLARGAKAFLPKPYSEAQLLKTLTEVLINRS